MTEPVPETTHDVDAEVDQLLASIVYSWGMDYLPEARGKLRRALMYAWYDGQSAGLNASRRDFQGRPNPWIRSAK